MTSVRRIFLASGAVALAASALLVPSAAFADDAVATTEATVAPQNLGNRAFTVSPKGPYVGGEKLTIKVSGYNPGELIVIMTCPENVWPGGAGGTAPGAGCAPFTAVGKGSWFGTVDGSGKTTQTIPVVKGTLLSTSYKCAASTPCEIVVASTDSTGIPAKNPTPYVMNFKTSSTSSSSGSSSSSNSSSSSSSSSSSGGSNLANTGPGDAPRNALAGLGLLVTGAVLVAATRPRKAMTQI
ncbi:unannotated protein [freshwater metagenome]|uniref:Unannotated protein n=1 Tax=freshwater metagenome TaxID=449393 RepID=A0A6J6XNJ5_9ZZZZ